MLAWLGCSHLLIPIFMFLCWHDLVVPIFLFPYSCSYVGKPCGCSHLLIPIFMFLCWYDLVVPIFLFPYSCSYVGKPCGCSHLLIPIFMFLCWQALVVTIFLFPYSCSYVGMTWSFPSSYSHIHVPMLAWLGCLNTPSVMLSCLGCVLWSAVMQCLLCGHSLGYLWHPVSISLRLGYVFLLVVILFFLWMISEWH